MSYRFRERLQIGEKLWENIRTSQYLVRTEAGSKYMLIQLHKKAQWCKPKYIEQYKYTGTIVHTSNLSYTPSKLTWHHVICSQFAIQHSPSNQKKSKHMSKVLGLGARKWLGEKIGSHVLGSTINKLYRALFDRVVDEMPTEIDMFSSGMKLPLRMSEHNSGLVIWVKNDQVFEWLKDFTKKSPKPNKFLGCVCSSYIFCFGYW